MLAWWLAGGERKAAWLAFLDCGFGGGILVVG